MLKKYIKRIFSWKKTLIIITSLGIIFGLAYSFTKNIEYKASSKLLILPRTTVGVDAYSAIKTAERLGDNLIQILYTSSFFNKIQATDYNIDYEYFHLNDTEKLKEQWSNMVNSHMIYNTGIMNLEVYHPDKKQAIIINQAINNILIHENSEYLSYEGFVKIKMIDEPYTEDWPARPNFLKNALLSGFIFLFLSIFIIIITSPEFKNEFKDL